MVLNEQNDLEKELRELEEYIENLRCEGYRVNESLLATLEQLKVELKQAK